MKTRPGIEEADGGRAPCSRLLAKALRVSTDQLLGLKPAKDTTSLRAARLVKGLQRIAQLPASERRVVLKLVDGLLEKWVRGNGRP